MGNIIPEMGIILEANLAYNGLFGKTRQALLAFLYSKAGSAFYTSQVLDAVKTGRGAVQRELSNLTDAGIIIREVHGRQVYYRANDKCPVFNELRNIVIKTSSQAGIVKAPGDMVARRFMVPKALLAGFCRKHHIRKLSLFGSILRDEFRPDSDIDVLVEFEPGHIPGFAIIDMENELSQIAGRKVDMRTPGDLSRYFRERVVREARVEYADAGT